MKVARTILLGCCPSSWRIVVFATRPKGAPETIERPPPRLPIRRLVPHVVGAARGVLQLHQLLPSPKRSFRIQHPVLARTVLTMQSTAGRPPVAVGATTGAALVRALRVPTILETVLGPAPGRGRGPAAGLPSALAPGPIGALAASWPYYHRALVVGPPLAVGIKEKAHGREIQSPDGDAAAVGVVAAAAAVVPRAKRVPLRNELQKKQAGSVERQKQQLMGVVTGRQQSVAQIGGFPAHQQPQLLPRRRLSGALGCGVE